jgi:hypothetical protein
MQYPLISTKSFCRALRAATMAATAALLAACSGAGGGPGGGAPAAAGMLRLALTDAPGCGFDHVYVTVEKVRIHMSSTAEPADGGWTEFALSPVRRVDLLTLTNGALLELGATALPSGHYGQLRLVLAASTTASGLIPNSVVPAGALGELALGIPSGQQSGVKIASSFDVTAGETADLIVDFDACKSVASAGQAGAYQLRPAIAVMRRRAGGIQGKLASVLAAGNTTVSAQQEGAAVRSTRPDSSGNFSIPFLQPGTYTLVITADGHATGVVTGVPVGTAMTAVSSAASEIALPASSMADISGIVSQSAAADAMPEVTTVVTDAQVRASQSLASGESIEVRSRPVDGVLGSYRLSVPKAPLVKAAYASSNALSFAPDASDGARYSIDIMVPEEPQTTQ